MRSCFNQFLICFVMARRAFIIRGIFTTATHPFSPASSRSVSLLVSNNIQTVNRWWILGSQGTSTSLETFHQRRDSLLTRQNQFTVKKKKKKKNAFLSACIATTFHPFGHLSPGRVKRKKKKKKVRSNVQLSRGWANINATLVVYWFYLQPFKFVIRNFNMERL